MIALSISADATNTAVVFATAATITIPNNANGEKARTVLISTDAICGVRPILTGEIPALSTMFRIVPNTYLRLNVVGLAGLRVDKPVAGTANVSVAPLENS